jgi:hypothetical protein
VISLRKAVHADLEESLSSALESYRAALIAVGDAGARAYPPTGENLKLSLLKLQESLVKTATPAAFTQTEQCVGQELKAWGDRASYYYLESAEDIKSLLLDVARAAAEVGDRDQRYGNHFRPWRGVYKWLLKLDDISAMRQSLSKSAVDLVSTISQMTDDGKRAVEQLREQISVR